MKTRTTLLLAPLITMPLLAWGGEGATQDLRYCLELQSNFEIAKCAGEISAGSKGRTYTKEDVARILAAQRDAAPSGAVVPPDTSDTGGQVTDLLLDQKEGGTDR